MKRIVAGILVFLVIGSSLSAVELAVGPKVSVGDYSYRGSDWQELKDLGFSNALSFSFAAGAFFNIQFIDLIGIQLETLYSYETMRRNTGSGWIQIMFSNVSIPLFARFNIDLGPVGLYALAGPEFNFLFDKVNWKNSDGTEGDFKISDSSDYTNFILSLALGIGVMIPAGPGVMDIGMGYSTWITRFDTTEKRYSYGLDIQIGYGFKL